MSENSRVLRNRTVTLTSKMNEKQADVYMRPYGPPPHFRGTPDEDVEDWMRLYERYSTAMKWDDVQRANNLVFVMEGEARQWFATALREATADNPLDTWTQWQAALRRDFAGEHVQDWAFIQLQERRQQSGETPQQYVAGILQLCARANTTMNDTEKVRCLLRGLRPEMMERVAITNPRTPAEFLQHLQRLTHVGAMARHALLAMPTHPLPGFAAASPFAHTSANGPPPVRENSGPGQEPSDLLHAQGRPHQAPTAESTASILASLQESMRALTAAVERMGQPQRQRFPPRSSRNQTGQAVCFRCNRPGHIMRQCNQPPNPPSEHPQPPRQGNW